MTSQPEYMENEFDSRIERFDACWESGVIPDISNYLLSEEVEPQVERRLELIAELVMIDLEYRWRQATDHCLSTTNPDVRSDDAQHLIPEHPFVEDYLVKFPELRDGKLTKVIASEYHTRHRWGDRPTHDGYLQRFPEHARALTKALRGVDQRLPRSSRGDRLKIRCPHCHTTIDSTALDLSEEIECMSCHCAFSLICDEPSSRRMARGGKIGGFQLIERLGSGSFGTVWKARDTQLDRDVAIKIPHREQLQSQKGEQFLREARTAAQLNHPNIVSVHEVGRDAETVFVVSDLIDGTPLSDWMKDRSFSAREAAALCQMIARALDHAHQAGVIHRDLKPANIIMDCNGQPHLTDFGLARREVGEVTMTRDGQLLGTPAYMSPEQAKGESHQADRRCDVYSLGVILFELLTGALPFRGNVVTLARQVIHDEPPSLRRLNNSIPCDLETICLKCLEKAPAKRYETARDVGDELGRFLNGEPIQARPISTVGKGWRWAKRNRRQAILGATAAGLGLVLSVGGPITALHEAASAKRLRWWNYVSDMILANHAWEEANVDRVRVLLRRHFPDPGQDDLRGFEWYYLWRRCRPSETTRAFPLVAPAWVAFSPDGRTLAATGRGRLHLWDLETNQELRTLDAHTTLAPGLAFSLDGRTLATASWDCTLKLWNFSETDEPTILNGGQPDDTRFAFNDLAISPDGRLLATNGPEHEVLLWDLKKPAIRLLHGHKTDVWYLAFSQQGHLATTGMDGQVILWNVETGEPFKVGDHGTGHTPVTFSPDSSTLVSGGEDDLIRLWDVANRELKATLKGHTLSVSSLSCSGDGKMLASGSRDGTVKLWDMHTYQLLGTLRGHGGNVLDVAFAPDGRTIASAGLDGNVKLWDVMAATRKVSFEGDRVAYPVREDVLLTWSTDGALRVWDKDAATLKASIACPDGGCVDRSPDGKQIALGHADGAVEIRATATGESRVLSERHRGNVTYVTFSPDGRHLASVGPSTHPISQEIYQLVKVWDLNTFTRLTTLEIFGNADPVFSPDSKTLAISSRAPEAEIYAIELYNLKGRRLARLDERHPVFSLAFSDDGTILAAGIWGVEIQIWDVATHQQVLPPLIGHTGVVDCVAFSPDQQRLASGSRDRTVKLWDLSTGVEVISLKGHRRDVVSVAFSPDGHTLASADKDGTVLLWRAASEQEVRNAGW